MLFFWVLVFLLSIMVLRFTIFVACISSFSFHFHHLVLDLTILAILASVKGNFIVTLIHISLVTHDVDNFSCAMRHSYVTCCGEPKYFVHLDWDFCYLIYRSSSYILNVSPFPVIYGPNIFPGLLAYYIIYGVFCGGKVCNFDVS